MHKSVRLDLNSIWVWDEEVRGGGRLREGEGGKESLVKGRKPMMVGKDFEDGEKTWFGASNVILVKGSGSILRKSWAAALEVMIS